MPIQMKFFKVKILLLLVFSINIGCRTAKPSVAFDPQKIPAAPDYSRLENWASHPKKEDLADKIPAAAHEKINPAPAVDVFFLHPTTLVGDKKSETPHDWNAQLDDEKLNLKTDKSAIQYQASIFNGSCRVFAPRYRQAHLHSFYEKKDSVSARRAVELAYSDVRAAFDFYLKNWNDGRPIIIAGHSQGALHGMYLLREFFDGKDLNPSLNQKLVAAYLAGWPVRFDFFKNLKPCQSPDEVGCYCSWRTFERKWGQRQPLEKGIVCTNPISWTTESGKHAAKTENRGAVVTSFDKIFENLCDAEVCGGILLCSKPKFPGSFLIRTKNYHPGDFNLYYFNVRENVAARAKAFFRK